MDPMGLVVTKKIIDEHGGQIDLQSEEGQGTTFTLILPYASNVAASPADTQGPGISAPEKDPFLPS